MPTSRKFDRVDRFAGSGVLGALVALALIAGTTGLGAWLKASALTAARRLGEREGVGHAWNARLIGAVSLGQRVLIADLLWLKTLQDASVERLGIGIRPQLYQDLKLASALDPLFLDVVSDGATLLGVIRDDNEGAAELLRQGNFVRRWLEPSLSPATYLGVYWRNRFKLVLSLIYTELFELLDLPGARVHAEQGARTPGSPDYFRGLADRLQTVRGRFDLAIRLMQSMAESYERATAPPTDAPKAASSSAKTRTSSPAILSQLASERVRDLRIAYWIFEREEQLWARARASGRGRPTAADAQALGIGATLGRDPWGGRLSFDAASARIRTETPYRRYPGLEYEPAASGPRSP